MRTTTARPPGTGYRGVVGWRPGEARHLAGAVALALLLCSAAAPGAAGDAAREVAAESPAGPHEPLQLREGRLRMGPAGEGDRVPDVTAYCLSCHDEEGGDAGTSTAATHPEASAAGDHPVDTAYLDGKPGYRETGDLAPRILLLNGRITCVTCHAHDDPEHSLVLTGTDSQLCRACHQV